MSNPKCNECGHTRGSHNRAGHDSGGCSAVACSCLDYVHDHSGHGGAFVDLRKRYAAFLVAKGNLIEALCDALDAREDMERPTEQKGVLSDTDLGAHRGWLLGKHMLTPDVRLILDATLAIPESERLDALKKDDDDGCS